MKDRTKLTERRFELQARTVDTKEGEAEELVVEGYAALYENRTVLFEYDGIEYGEEIARGAFDGAKMDDVILNYNHGGKVMARTRNHTLELSLDDTGLHIRARLDGTEEGRRLYDEIQGGYIDRMSFAFTIEQEAYNKEEHFWRIEKVKRVFDVSAVDIPAYDDTSIEARKALIVEADAHEEERVAAEAALARRRLELKIKLSNNENGGTNNEEDQSKA